MASRQDRPIAEPDYLWRIWFYPVAGLTLLGGALLAARDWSTGGWHYRFLVWNTFLAWIPYACSVFADRLDRWRPASWGWLILLAVAWLAFLPNAPYILTDFIHLRHAPPSWFRYDAVLIGTFAAAGCLLGIVSIQIMQRLVRRHAGGLWGWLFAAGVLGLSGVGIYMGRVLRWNSWDLLTSPDEIANTLFGVVADPLDHRRAIVLSVILAVFLMGCYVAFTLLSDWLFDPPRRPGQSSFEPERQ